MKPEIAVRSMVHRLGYRFRLHRRNLPGAPDLVLPRHRAVIFVNGCFWHWHSDPLCSIAGLPKSNLQYWEPKLARTRIRDQENIRLLEAKGWRVLTIWECQLNSPVDVLHGIRVFLGTGTAGNRVISGRGAEENRFPVEEVISRADELPCRPSINLAALRSLLDSLEETPLVAEPQPQYDGGAVEPSRMETVALALEHAIRGATRANWRGNRRREAEVRRAIKRVLTEDTLVETVFRAVKTQNSF